jgi:8-oxo-dGTP pyrophosphatase MutT (NUDIX family)
MAPSRKAPTPGKHSQSGASEAGKKSPPSSARATKTKEETTAALGIEARLSSGLSRMRAEFEVVRARVRDLRSKGTAAFDELYEEIGRVLESDPPLYVAGDYRTREAFIAAELPGETLRSVMRNVLVARCFSPEDEQRHGIGFLEEVALYAKELAGADQPPRAIHLDRLVITLRAADGTTVGKPARDATIEEVRTARRLLRGGASTGRKAPPAEKALRAALGKNKALAQIAVRASADKVSFGGVPLAGLTELARVLATVEIPVETGATAKTGATPKRRAKGR